MDCINLKNCCPTCKTVLKKEENIKNYLIDDILSKNFIIILGYLKAERSQEQYNNIENSYMYKDQAQNYKLNRIQFLFFENLKQIFNTYDSFLVKIEKEKNICLEELNKKIEEVKTKV